MSKFIFKLSSVAAISLLFGCSSFFYQNEPYTSLEVSSAFNAGGTNYFLLKLRIYHPAKGIAAFPDGGKPKNAIEGIYLFKLDKSGPKKAAELGMPAGLSGAYFRSSEIRGEKNGVLIKIPWMDPKFYSKKLNPDKKGSERVEEYYLFDPASAKVSVVKDPGGVWPKETKPVVEPGKFFSLFFSDFDALGLPNPLNYLPGSGKPKNLAKLISKGGGDKHLRFAAARRLMASGNEKMLSNAITGIDKYTTPLNKYYRDEDKAVLEKIILEPGKKKGE